MTRSVTGFSQVDDHTDNRQVFTASRYRLLSEPTLMMVFASSCLAFQMIVHLTDDALRVYSSPNSAL